MPTVLIVDDEQHIRLLIEQTLEDLEDEGVELQTASDGEMALDVVRNHSPELVFLDVMMPKLNGFDVCRAIKGTSAWPDDGRDADGEGPGVRPRGGARGGRGPLSDEAVRPGRAPRDRARGARVGWRHVSDLDLGRLIVRHRRVAPLLSAVLSGTDAGIRISAADGTVSLEREGDGIGGEQFPITLDGEPVGSVDGDRSARAVAAVLSYAVAREADKRSLAGEALDRYRELNLVYELADRLSGDLDGGAVGRIAIAEASRLPSGGSGFLLLADGDGPLRPVADGSGLFASGLGPVTLGSGIIGAVAAARTAEEVNDVAADPRASDGERTFASLVVAPVVAGGRTIGVLGAGTKTRIDYTSADLKLLTAIAAITGPALAHARATEACAARPAEARSLQHLPCPAFGSRVSSSSPASAARSSFWS